jgi:sigma-B regulation protein RsbU (phosphoserine phosphatase)
MVDLLHTAPCGLFSFTDEGIIVQANESFCALLQYRSNDLLQRKVTSIFTIATSIFYQTHFFPLLKGNKEAREIFITLKSATGAEVPVLLNARRVEGGGAAENVCACLPIYQRMNYEDELIAARKLAEKAVQESSHLQEARTRLQEHITLLDDKMYELKQRNDDLRELGKSVSHDLQEPIRKLALYADLLLHQKDKISEEETLRKLVAQTGRIKTLILALQDYLWLEKGPDLTTDIDLTAVLLVARQKVMAEYPGVEIALQAKALPAIRANFDQLVLLFYHLLSNSVKFRSPSKPLEVTVRHTLLNVNRFKSLPDHYQYTGHYKIIYSDNGIGFDERYKDQVFRLFSKLHSGTGGLGIGLALVRKVVVNHKGAIEVFSKEQEGTTFSIVLPQETASLRGEFLH